MVSNFATVYLIEKIDMSADSFFNITMATVVLAGGRSLSFPFFPNCAASTAILQGGLFGLSGTMPWQYTQALMSGQVNAHLK